MNIHQNIPFGGDPRSKLPSIGGESNGNDYSQTSEEMLVPIWLGYVLLLGRSLFHQKTLMLLFLIFSVYELRQTTLHWGKAMLTVVHMSCETWQTQVNSLMNLHVRFVQNMTHIQVNLVNSVTTNAYSKSLEGLELFYTMFIYAIERYFYAEKCLAVGTISTVLDFSSKYSNSIIGGFEWLPKSIEQWNRFVKMLPNKAGETMKFPIDFSIPSIPHHINGDEFTQWWQQQEQFVNNRLNPMSLLQSRLPTLPLKVLQEDMFPLPKQVELTFCDDIRWAILDRAIQTLVFYATMALMALIIAFCIYMVGCVAYAYWELRREVRHEKKYSVRLLIDCGIFNRNILWKQFVCYTPAINAFAIGLLGLAIFLTLDRVILSKKDGLQEAAVRAVNQSVIDSLRPIDRLSQDMSLKLFHSYNSGMDVAKERITGWQASIFEWVEKVHQGQERIEDELRNRNMPEGVSLMTKNIRLTFKCLTALFTNSLNIVKRIATLDVTFPKMPLDIRFIHTEEIATHLSLVSNHLLNYVFEAYSQRLRKQMIFYAVLMCIGAFVPLIGTFVYLCLLLRARFRR